MGGGGGGGRGRRVDERVMVGMMGVGMESQHEASKKNIQNRWTFSCQWNPTSSVLVRGFDVGHIKQKNSSLSCRGKKNHTFLATSTM